VLTGSIRARLLVWLLGTLALGAAVMGGVTYRGVRGEIEELFDYQLRQMALSLRDQGAIDVVQAHALDGEGFDFVVQIWTVDGRTIYSSRAYTELPARAVLGFADVAVGAHTWRTYSVPAGDRVIQVAQPLQIRQQLAVGAALRSVAPLLLIAPLLALALWWVVARALRPLQRVASDVRERDADSLEPLVLAGLPSEVSPLVQALNALLLRLGDSFDTQRAFVSDAAHELRSPLTALRLQIGRLRRAPDAAGREAALQALSSGVERAVRLVEQLLTLARSEPGAASPQTELLDLHELVRQAVADVVPQAVARDSVIELAGGATQPEDGAVQVRGERAALSALVRNLADNAVRYSPPGSTVLVRVAAEDGAPGLWVDDAGPGIPPHERERVFHRFYRRHPAADDAAAPDQAAGPTAEGTGLGLAIVRSVAQRHGARVTLHTSPAGGLRVRVRFPPA
jgi:two-component system OmpR family sensor kinase/two-component system sensor histidine kinase QseC